jgi:hypothetical protein
MRSDYLGGSLKGKGKFDLDTYRGIRKTFIDNLNNVDYVADFRGGGNYTLRFYETLCTGRIPIVLDSERVFPLDEIINWHEHVIIIPFKQIKSSAQIVHDFHVKNAQSLGEMKKSNRKLWEDYLSPEAYYKNIFELLKSKYR